MFESDVDFEVVRTDGPVDWLTRHSVRMEHTRVIRFFLTRVRTAVMQNVERVVTLISHDDRVTTQIMASFDGRNELIKHATSQAVIIVET